MCLHTDGILYTVSFSLREDDVIIYINVWFECVGNDCGVARPKKKNKTSKNYAIALKDICNRFYDLLLVSKLPLFLSNSSFTNIISVSVARKDSFVIVQLVRSPENESSLFSTFPSTICALLTARSDGRVAPANGRRRVWVSVAIVANRFAAGRGFDWGGGTGEEAAGELSALAASVAVTAERFRTSAAECGSRKERNGRDSALLPWRFTLDLDRSAATDTKHLCVFFPYFFRGGLNAVNLREEIQTSWVAQLASSLAAK